jgi:hypothetical protein
MPRFYISPLLGKSGMIPYHDIHECNMPGTYFSCLLVGRLIGYSNTGVRILVFSPCPDCLPRMVLDVRTKQPGGLFGRIAWAQVFLGVGLASMIQREYMMMFPLQCGLAAYSNIPL